MPNTVAPGGTPRSFQFDHDDSLPLGCPHCNAPMKKGDDLCDHCGYHMILKKVIDISDMKKPNQTTGFERLLTDQLHESESAGGTLLLIKIVAAVMMLGVLFLCLGRWWWVGVLAVGAAVAIYWSIYLRRASGDEASSTVNQDPVSAVAWSLLLAIQRTFGWRKLNWPFPRVKSLIFRNAGITDEELAEVEGLDSVEALDLEATPISDAGLVHLRGLKQLRFLVVRQTQVTPAGVRRLQQDLPQAMIWQ